MHCPTLTFLQFSWDRVKYVKRDFTFWKEDILWNMASCARGQSCSSWANMVMNNDLKSGERGSQIFARIPGWGRGGIFPPKKRWLQMICSSILEPYNGVSSHQVPLCVLYTRAHLGEMRSISKLCWISHLFKTFSFPLVVEIELSSVFQKVVLHLLMEQN